MEPSEKLDQLDRHAFIMAVWLPLGLVALVLFRLGLGEGGWPWLVGGFAAILVAFVAHVTVNAALGTDFSRGEVALGLVLFLAAVLSGGLALLVADDLDAGRFWTIAGGLAALAAAAILSMLIRYGTRGAFESFDAMRQSNPRPASRLTHRGGRR